MRHPNPDKIDSSMRTNRTDYEIYYYTYDSLLFELAEEPIRYIETSSILDKHQNLKETLFMDKIVMIQNIVMNGVRPIGKIMVDG